MIKFFRKIRLQLLNKNKVGKYLLYAIGEIVLVVIGILIALNLNQRNEQKKTEAKIDAIFEEVLKDLKTNIDQSTNIIYHSRRKDSLISLVLKTNLTPEDYADENSRDLRILLLTLYGYNINDNAYHLLMNNIDAIPEKYNESVAQLNNLYTDYRRPVEKFSKLLENHMEASINILEEMPWYSEPDHIKRKKSIAYHLDYRYKNRVNTYRRLAIHNKRTHIIRFRAVAIECYKEIASILNKPLDSLEFILDKLILNSYVGTYVNDSNPELKAELSINENGFLLVIRDSPFRRDVLRNLSSENIFSSWQHRGGIFRFHNRNSKNGITMSIHEGHIPVYYTKLKP
jgi:hypothetical protein